MSRSLIILKRSRKYEKNYFFSLSLLAVLSCDRTDVETSQEVSNELLSRSSSVTKDEIVNLKRINYECNTYFMADNTSPSIITFYFFNL